MQWIVSHPRFESESVNHYNIDPPTSRNPKMKFLIAPASAEQINDSGTEGLFVGIDKCYYNYMIEYTENEDVVITDNVGRRMPICIFDVRGLQLTLDRIAHFQEAQEACYAHNVQTLLQGIST